MLKSEQVKIALDVGEMSAENQRDFFEMLGERLTEGEVKAFQIVVAYLNMISNPQKLQAMKNAMAENLYKEYKRKEKK